MELTSRQREAAALVASGIGRTELAAALGVSLSGADKALRALKDRFGVSTQAELALACARYMQSPSAGSKAHTTGPLNRQSALDVSHIAERTSETFAPPQSFTELFDQLLKALLSFGVTHVTYSHITRNADDESVKHLATRWSFPETVQFDFSIPPEDNLAFKHALSSWDAVPMDLEAMAASDLYRYVPEAIRAQNDHFMRHGLTRGVTYVLPGLNAWDRLVISVLLQHASVAMFQAFVHTQMANVYPVLQKFRNMHIAMASQPTKLSPREREALSLYARGYGPEEIATAMKLSRRAVERVMTDVRNAYDVRSNAAAVARFVDERYNPVLPF